MRIGKEQRTAPPSAETAGWSAPSASTTVAETETDFQQEKENRGDAEARTPPHLW